VYPVIEESEKTDLKAATTMYERLVDWGIGRATPAGIAAWPHAG
jgi:RecG-like helicase